MQINFAFHSSVTSLGSKKPCVILLIVLCCFSIGSLTRTENDISEVRTSQPGNNKKVKRGFLRTLLCCLGRNRSKTQSPNQYVFGRGSPTSPTDSPRYLLPPVRHQDMHKMCMVIDLDETLVHSSFKVC